MLTSFQLVKKFPAFYGTQRFITAFTSALHLFLSWARSIQSMPPPSHFLKIHLNILLPSLPLRLPSGLFPSGFPTKTLYSPLFSLIRATCPAQLILLHLITLIIFSEAFRSLNSSLCSFLHSHYLVPLRPKYGPQHPIFKHPQPTFLPQCERPCFTHILNNRQSNYSVYLNLYIFGQQTGRQKILHWMIASIPWLWSDLNFFLNRILIH